MNNRDYGVWLIPVLAALALYVPFTTGTKPQPLISSSLSPETTAAGGQQGREIASAGLLPEFLGTNDLAATISQSQKTSITFVIATVPDPRDSSLGYIYDRHLAAIQLASQRANYVLDRFDLPWNDKEDKTIQQGKTIDKYKLDGLGVRKLPEEPIKKPKDNLCRAISAKPASFSSAVWGRDPQKDSVALSYRRNTYIGNS